MVKILFFKNTSGVISQIRPDLEKQGYRCTIIGVNINNKFSFDFDYEIQADRYKEWILNAISWRMETLSYIWKNDIIHFNYNTVLPFGLDLILWRLLGKKVIVHRHGDDIRGKGESKIVEWFANKILVSTPDLLEFAAERSEWMPNPIDLGRIKYVGAPKNSKVTIVHAPSLRKNKGTEIIMKAVNELKKKYDIEFVLVEKIPNNEALDIYRKADIVIDQINLAAGWYGFLSTEAMALGKPTAAYIKEGLYDPSIPIVNINGENIFEKIEELILDPEKREKLGRESRAYAERVHDSKKVFKRYLEILDEICGGKTE